MAKKCKDCDPNKYIEGLAWRGKNGSSYDGYTIYNDVGKPSSTDITLADVSDLIDAYNPIFSGNNASLPESRNVPVEIAGIDKAQGFWFVWSFINGMVMYGVPGVKLNAAAITSAASTTARIGQGFNFNVTLDQTPSYLTYTDFGIFADSNLTTDQLRFSSINSNVAPLTKNTVNYVGYYTGIIKSVLNGNKYITTGKGKNKKTQLETFEASKSLTIMSRDSQGNNPVYVTSDPTIHAFKNQGFNYVLTTNIDSSKVTVSLTSGLNILQNLGLNWNPNTKTISGTVSNNLSSEIKTAQLNFTVDGPDADAGNRVNFTLNILYGQQKSTDPLPTITAKAYSGTVATPLKEASLNGLNNKHTIIGITSLPAGLSFNSTKKTISGTPKHAGTFIAYASCSNARGSSSKVTLTFNFSAYNANNKQAGSTYPSLINLPTWSYNSIKNNSILLSLYTNPTQDDTIQFKKINRSEFETIRKNGKPDNIQFNGKIVPQTIFEPGKGIDAETCFWIQVDDPNTGRKDKDFDINIQGNYDIELGASGLRDSLGNTCYSPDQGVSGPASTPFSETLNVTISNSIKTGLSANPAENVPTVTISPTQVEHQVIFDGSTGALEKNSDFAKQKLPKSGLDKYPNGIPAQNGVTYKFNIVFADVCAFSTSAQPFHIYFSTYSPRAGDIYSCSSRQWQPASRKTIGGGRWVNVVQDVKLTSSSVPAGCNTVVSRAGDSQTINSYGFRYGNVAKDTKDIGIGSLTNISILDIIGEGPIEGIVDYEIVPNPGATIGDIGYKNGVKITRYNGNDSILRSVYWNEIPIADNNYPDQGSLNFEFIQLQYDYANSAPRHSNLDQLQNIKLEEPYYSKRNNGEYINKLTLRNLTTGPVLQDKIRLPRKLTNTKVVGSKLFGKRKFQDGREKTYKKSLTVLTKDLYGLRLHIKALSLFKSIVDLTIWDSADQAAANSVSGRTDRQEMTFYLYLKRIDYYPNKGKTVTIMTNPDYVPNASTVLFNISEQDYYDQVWRPNNDPLSLYWPPNDPGGPGNGPDGYQRQPANYNEFINGITTYEHRHDRKVYNSYAKDVTKLQRDFRQAKQDYIDQVQRVGAPAAKDYATLTIAGKLNQGPYIETFEWTGLNTKSTSFTVGWEIEIVPVYEESVDANIVLKSAIDSVTEIYDDFLAIPHTAGVLTTFDSRFFSSIPQRAYDTRLLKVKIPSNYNPYSKTYDGIWNGSFNLGWTDNPAWCFFDLITNRRYGLGKYVDPDLTDKWTLYEIGQYCDQLVSSGGSGLGLEPRFTCNVLISSREDAYKVVNDMASIFRAIVFYNGGLIFASQDRPKDPLYIFNNSNVKDGEFTYSNTSKRVRRNVALVRYNDKENFYKPAVKYVESREGLIRFGIKEIEVSAFGCTSEGQAERLGKWTLLSENLESELVNFETSLPAMYLKPGDIVLVQDQNRQNRILGGRTYELKKDYAILDVKYSDISGFLPSINGCNFNVLTPAGNIEFGSETGNAILEYAQDNFISTSVIEDLESATATGSSTPFTSIIRRKQVQTIKYESDYTINNTGTTNVFGIYASLETTGNFQGYTRLNFAGQSLDDTQHTLIQNTVWTIEINPDNYDYNKSPSISGFSDRGTTGVYPGAFLEPYIDKTQKFRILDIEEQEEFRYKITALQYDESKYDLGDNI
jgi:hypothetical protein